MPFDPRLDNLQAKAAALLKAWELPLSKYTQPPFMAGKHDGAAGYYIATSRDGLYDAVEIGWRTDTDHGEMPIGNEVAEHLDVVWQHFGKDALGVYLVRTNSARINRLRVTQSAIEVALSAIQMREAAEAIKAHVQTVPTVVTLTSMSQVDDLMKRQPPEDITMAAEPLIRMAALIKHIDVERHKPFARMTGAQAFVCLLPAALSVLEAAGIS